MMLSEKARILVVDDNPTNLNVLIEYLEHVGYEMIAAEDGEDALEQLEYVTPDVILLDVMMPELDGFETCERIKANPSTKDIPVIFMTALAETVDKVKGFQVGAVDYITKPLQQEEVLARVKTHLTIRELQTQLEARVADRTHRLQVISDVSHRLNEIHDLDGLLTELVNLIQKSFNYDHTLIYLIDELKGDLYLAEAAGEMRTTLLTHTHRVAIGEGVVGKVAQNRTHFLSNHIAETEIITPLKPYSKAELAVSLNRRTLLGVLDIHSNQADFFTPDDISVLQAIADEAAIAIENAWLLREKQATIIKIKALDRAKSQFIGMMSHELRTPINAILGFSELLLMGLSDQLTDRATDDVQHIYNSGKHLLTLINDILEIAQIEAKQTDFTVQPLSVNELIGEVVTLSRVFLKEKLIEIVVDVPTNLPSIMADPNRIKQILLNLLSNAIKFSDTGTVTIKVEPLPNQEMMLFSVKDTGIGIPSNLLEEIFEPFIQVDMSDTRLHGGIGLGLTICRELVELHGGQIGVSSKEGVGSEFRFTIPLASSFNQSKFPHQLGDISPNMRALQDSLVEPKTGMN